MKALILLSAIIFYCFKICHAQPGNLDSSFGTNGSVTADLGNKVHHNSFGIQTLLQPDGSMYVILQRPVSQLDPETKIQMLVAKRHSNGIADSSYGVAGFSVSVPMKAARAIMQPDGKIVVVGSI